MQALKPRFGTGREGTTGSLERTIRLVLTPKSVGLCWEQMRQAVVHKGEDGQWVAECMSLPGCVSQGQSRKEAVNNMREAIQLYVRVLEEDNLPIPEERFDTLLIAV